MSSSLMSPLECAGAYKKRPNAIIRDGEFAQALNMCEKEHHATEDVLSRSSEWRKRWLEQQELPLPPPSYREYESPMRLMGRSPSAETPWVGTTHIAALPATSELGGLSLSCL